MRQQAFGVGIVFHSIQCRIEGDADNTLPPQVFEFRARGVVATTATPFRRPLLRASVSSRQRLSSL
jgi:hypothetical protein